VKFPRATRQHRLFSFITMNWRGKPLVSHAVVIALIGATTTDTGLTVRCEQDEAIYQKGTKVSDAEMGAINNVRDEGRTTAQMER
jgi:hypothetical protein